ncbi:MAG: pitrilysin family protein [Candidatus Aminicenantes bacterium]|nr:pitrilysin family protein [Candidatus Aminicenantes bacterium]
MKRVLTLSLAVLALTAFVSAGAITLDVKEHTLANGMKILMITKPGVPRVVCHIYYKVGSINERPGITGTAHVHEHLMFKGTKMMGVTDFEKDTAIDRQIDEVVSQIYREKYWKSDGDPAKIAELQKKADELIAAEKAYIIKDDLWGLYMKNGGTGLNASTSQESTGYYVTLPSNKIELQMLLESDRMQSAYFREFYSENDVIMEERRLSENSPGYFFSEQVNAAFFAASPYHWDVIGWMDDLKKMTKADLIEFHNRYYVPNNAVAIYVGDLDLEKTIAMAEQYFGRIPKGPDIEPIRTYEPPQYGEKRMYGEGPAPTSVQIMFHTPWAGQPDVAPLTVLAGILGAGGGPGGPGGPRGGGGTGRLDKILVQEKQLAVNASAFNRAQWYVGAFQFSASPRLDKGVEPEDLEREIWAEIEKIKKDGVTDDEIQKIKNRSEANFIRSLASTAGLAGSVGRAELNRGWKSILSDLEDIKKVTNDDIKRVAAAYFVKDNSLTSIYTRKMGR